MNSSCAVAAQVATDELVILAHFLIVLFDFCSFLTLGVYILVQCKISGVHLNVWVLRVNVAIALLLRNVYTFGRSGQKLVTLFLNAPPCSFQVAKQTCMVESIVGRQPVFAAMIGLDVMTGERVLATLFYKKYERFNSPVFAAFLCSIQWIYVAVTCTPAIVDSFSVPNTLLDYCSSLNSIGINFWSFVTHLVVGTSGAIIVCLVLWFLNKKLKKFKLKNPQKPNYLSEEFQRRENIRTTKELTVQMIVFMTAYLLNAYFGYRISWAQNDNLFRDLTQFVVVKEFTSLVFPIYANVYALLGLVSKPEQGHVFLSYLTCNCWSSIARRQNRPAAIAPTQQEYFQYYASQWK